jgi:hypothetical protein
VDQNGIIRMIKVGKRAEEKDIADIIKTAESLLNPPPKRSKKKH